MKVIVLGATGFIGLRVAQAFIRAGHIVYGTTRSANGGRKLAQDEIQPIICDPSTPEGSEIWGKVAESADIVIDILPSNAGPAVPLGSLRMVEEISKGRPVGAKITYIYGGGAWTQARGTGGLDKWTSETQPHSGQVELTKWRWQVEEPVLASKDLHGIVVRPSLVYGHSGSLWVDPVFKPALEASKKGGNFEAFGYAHGRIATIHVDDLADLFLRAGERGTLLGGQTFIGSNPASERMTDIYDAVARASGAKGYTLRNPSSAYEEAFSSTALFKPFLGLTLTGWVPRKTSLVDGMDVYWASWLASEGK